MRKNKSKASILVPSIVLAFLVASIVIGSCSYSPDRGLSLHPTPHCTPCSLLYQLPPWIPVGTPGFEETYEAYKVYCGFVDGDPRCGVFWDTIETTTPASVWLDDVPSCSEPHEGYYCNMGQSFVDLPTPPWGIEGSTPCPRETGSLTIPTPTPPTPMLPTLTSVEADDVETILTLVNTTRELHGLSVLKLDLDLSRAARVKAHDIVINDYFGHESPTYGSPADLLHSLGIQCPIMAENLAISSSVRQAYLALMASSGHRHAILYPDFDVVGISVLDTRGRKLVVQVFCKTN